MPHFKIIRRFRNRNWWAISAALLIALLVVGTIAAVRHELSKEFNVTRIRLDRREAILLTQYCALHDDCVPASLLHVEMLRLSPKDSRALLGNK